MKEEREGGIAYKDGLFFSPDPPPWLSPEDFLFRVFLLADLY